MSNTNTGNWNTGDRNTGYCNTGDRNTGDWNTGNCNTGDRNTGYCNTGDRNTGNWNTGDRNTGNWNTGDRNTGNWNTGNCNTGVFNTDEPKMRSFNKECSYTRCEYEDEHGWIYPDLHTCQWILYSNMTEQEKKDNPHAKDTDGYLKTMEYKEAWKEYWERADDEDKKWFLDLPNFDAKIFEEITGINVNENSKKKELLDKADELIKKAEELKSQAEKL